MFFNLKPHKHIALHQIHKIMFFLATSYDPFNLSDDDFETVYNFVCNMHQACVTPHSHGASTLDGGHVWSIVTTANHITFLVLHERDWLASALGYLHKAIWLADACVGAWKVEKLRPIHTGRRRQRLSFTLNGVTSSVAELNCGSIASLHRRCSRQKLKTFQAPTQASANQIGLCKYPSADASQSCSCNTEMGTRVSDLDSSRIFINFRLDSDSTWNDSDSRKRTREYFKSNSSLLSLKYLYNWYSKADRIRTPRPSGQRSRNSSHHLSEQNVKNSGSHNKRSGSFMAKIFQRYIL